MVKVRIMAAHWYVKSIYLIRFNTFITGLNKDIEKPITKFVDITKRIHWVT